MNLGTKTIILLAIIVSTVLIISGSFMVHYQEVSLKQTIFKGIDGQAKIAAHGIEAFVDEGLMEARAVAVTLPEEALLRGDMNEVESHLKKMFETFPKFKNGIFILDRQGRFLGDYPSHPELKGKTFAYREYYQRTIREKNGIVGKPYKSARTGLPVLTFTAPVHDTHGQFIAVVACSADLLSEEALGGYRKQKFGDSGYLFIFDRARQLVLHPDGDRLLTYVEAGKNKIMDAALGGFQGGGEAVNSQGVPMLLAVRQVPKTDWIVAVQVPQKEAYAPISEAREHIIFMAGIAILLVIIIGAVAIRRVTGPLHHLESVALRISRELDDAETKGTYAVADSSFDVLKKIHSHDEIGMLASSFLGLTAKLKQTFGSLQRAAGDWERTFNSVHEAVITLDRESRIVRMNRAAEDLFRATLQKVRDQYGYCVVFGTDAPPPEWPDIASLAEQGKFKWSQSLEKPCGTFEFTMTPVVHAEAAVGAVLVISDVTERVESEERIRGMAFYDSLTALPNRILLQDRIRLAVVSADDKRKKAGIMFLDLDHFKLINDRYGHDVGDEVLRETANRISVCLRKKDTLSRLGGDEFVVVLQDIEHQSEAAAVAERIIEELAIPIITNGHKLTISASIGISVSPDDGEDGETLLKNADMAMYQAKRLGRNNYNHYCANV